MSMSFLTNECGVKGQAVATGKALLYSIAGAARGVAETASYGVINARSVDGVVIAAAVGSGVGLIIGINEAYEDFESDTAGCRESQSEMDTFLLLFQRIWIGLVSLVNIAGNASFLNI